MQKKILVLILSLLLFSACTGNVEKKQDKEESMTNTIVQIETSLGVMEFKLYDDQVPKTVDNFKKLINKGFYDGIIFHRIIKNFMAQTGDPEGTGTGGPGYTIDDEFVSSLKHDKKGLLSMANTGSPNSGGSQFFITFLPTPWLDGKHTIFGELVKGEEVLAKLTTVKTGAGDRPIKELVMKKVTIL